MPGQSGPVFGRWLLDQLRRIGEDLVLLGNQDVDSVIRQERVDLPAGARRRVSPSTNGLAVVLEAPGPGNAGDSSVLIIESPVGAVTVTASPHVGADGKVSPSLINGARQATFSRSGAVVFYSNGVDGWKTHAETPAEGTEDDDDRLDEALDASVLLGAPSGAYPNGRVVQDSTEVDAVLTTSGVISWALNTASVALSKLADLAGISVLGRASSSSGVMAAITATGGNQKLVSNAAGTSIGWVSDLGAIHEELAWTGTKSPYQLPAAFRSGDIIKIQLTGNTTLNGITDSTGAMPPDGTLLYLAVFDQSGGAAPGWTLTIPDGSGITGQFRTPGQVQGTTPGPSYVMQSEEEAAVCVSISGAWRIVGGTAAQAVDGDITLSSGNGATRTAAITAGVIVNADISGTAAIALSKLATQAANSVVANATAGTAAPTAVAVGTNTVLGRVAGNIVAAQLATGQCANDAIDDTKLRNSGALSVIGRSANSSGDPADISATAASGAVLRESGSALGFGTVAAAGLADGIISPAKLAVLTSSIGGVFTIFVAVTAGGGGADDVTIYNANAPFAFRVLDVLLLVATAVGGASAQLRDTSGGGGSALSSVLDGAATGTKRNDNTATATVAASGSVFLRRSDSGIGGELVILCVRT